MTPSQKAKSMGLESLNQVSEITGASPQTLSNWAKHKPKLFQTVLAGCVVQQRELIQLSTVEEIEQAVQEGSKIEWRGNPVVQTTARKLLVNVPINAERYHSWKLETVIKVFGVNDFYKKAPE